MAGVPVIAPEDMTVEYKHVYYAIVHARGGVVRGPFSISLTNLEIADHANRLGNAVRTGGKLDKRLFEIMLLAVPRHHRLNTSGSSRKRMHSRQRSPRLSRIAIPTRREPEFAQEDETVVYDTSPS